MYTRPRRVCVCIIKKDFIWENIKCVKIKKNTYDAYTHYAYIIVVAVRPKDGLVYKKKNLYKSIEFDVMLNYNKGIGL